MKYYLFFLLFLASCAVVPTQNETQNPFLDDPLFCNVDADCACGGVDKQSGDCFIGNKLFQSMYVDITQSCPDFCTGIGGHFDIKCVDHACKQIEVERDMFACTMEAKICPDGSTVGRTGPECEFELCPGEMGGCPEDAKVCDDGSVVVRIGPDCEFESCPGEESKCTKDSDCVFDSCCHSKGCVHKDKAPLCDAVACTMNCEPETLDCGGSCACVDGECVGQNYFG